MKIKKLILTGASALIVAGLMGGCAQKPVAKCGVPDFCKPEAQVRVKIKKVPVSECPKRVKTVVYKGICKNCNNDFPVTVRENSCCQEGACK